ncbi:MAG: hypothetical protein RL708_2193 [Bacteroidota bacterium]|jgi:hypothetical protein
MKKILIVVFVFLSITVKSNAQGFFVGFHGGLNNVWISNINPLWSRVDSLKPLSHKISSTNNTFRGGFGAQVGFEFNKNVAIVTELNGQYQGYKYQDSTLSKGIINGELSSSYLQIPLMLKLMAGHDGSGFFIMAGPSYSILQNATLTESGKNLHEVATDLKEKNYVIKKEIGITSVLGIQFRAADHFLFTFGFRGNFGTKNINNLSPSVSNFSIPKSINGSVGINLSAGYHF